MRPTPPRAPTFPYTTLFRSGRGGHERQVQRIPHVVAAQLGGDGAGVAVLPDGDEHIDRADHRHRPGRQPVETVGEVDRVGPGTEDRKSTRLNSSHVAISYAVF